jgi:hypothetical protein
VLDAEKGKKTNKEKAFFQKQKKKRRRKKKCGVAEYELTALFSFLFLGMGNRLLHGIGV